MGLTGAIGFDTLIYRCLLMGLDVRSPDHNNRVFRMTYRLRLTKQSPRVTVNSQERAFVFISVWFFRHMHGRCDDKGDALVSLATKSRPNRDRFSSANSSVPNWRTLPECLGPDKRR